MLQEDLQHDQIIVNEMCNNHQLRKLMARNSNNNELYLHDHTSTYSIAKAVFRNQSYNTGTAKNHLFSGTYTERLMY